jgi:hypothetical protein
MVHSLLVRIASFPLLTRAVENIKGFPPPLRPPLPIPHCSTFLPSPLSQPPPPQRELSSASQHYTIGILAVSAGSRPRPLYFFSYLLFRLVAWFAFRLPRAPWIRNPMGSESSLLIGPAQRQSSILYNMGEGFFLSHVPALPPSPPPPNQDGHQLFQLPEMSESLFSGGSKLL